MPKISHDRETEIRRAMRDAYALDPIISDQKLLRFLEERFKHSFAWPYIARLKRKVRVEATPDLDREKVQDRLRQTRETFRMGRENLLPIASGVNEATNMERTAAWRTIAMFEKMLLEIEIELGLYSGAQASNPDMFRYEPIPAGIREAMLRTLQAWSMPAGLTRVIAPAPAIDAESRVVPPIAPIAPPGQPQEAQGPVSHAIQPDGELFLG